MRNKSRSAVRRVSLIVELTIMESRINISRSVKKKKSIGNYSEHQ